MLKLLGSLGQYLKVSGVKTESTLFRMHNKLTTVLLLASSVILTATQYVGSPISCLIKGIPEHPINTYCWIMSTFTMPDAYFREVSILRLLINLPAYLATSRFRLKCPKLFAPLS